MQILRSKADYLIFQIVVIKLFFIASILFNVWQYFDESGYVSCLYSVAGEIEMLDKTKSLSAKSSDWKILSEEEVIALMSQIHGYDCGKTSNQTLDMWSHRINIALRRPNRRLEISVWSNGRDNISGTNDDLVFPYGEKPPQ